MERRRVGVVGVGGRMGVALVEALGRAEDLVLAAAVDRPGAPSVGTRIGGVEVGAAPAGVFDAVDLVIEFATPDMTEACAVLAAERRVPLVSGTTGLHAAAEAALDRAAAVVPVLWAPNMSVGVHLLLRLVAEAARTLGPEFDAEVVEIHHRMKKDAPSGTAARIAAVLAESGRGPVVFGREGITGARPAGEIGVHAVRGGDVVGDHLVLFAGPGERVELVHRAASRATFAEGALRAARWLLGQRPGRYGMDDVLAV